MRLAQYKLPVKTKFIVSNAISNPTTDDKNKSVDVETKEVKT